MSRNYERVLQHRIEEKARGMIVDLALIAKKNPELIVDLMREFRELRDRAVSEFWRHNDPSSHQWMRAYEKRTSKRMDEALR